MNKSVVMTAIERRMDWIYDKMICNPKNEGKDMTTWNHEIKELYDAYMELRGHAGSVVYVAGIDGEVNNVKSIYELTRYL